MGNELQAIWDQMHSDFSAVMLGFSGLRNGIMGLDEGLNQMQTTVTKIQDTVAKIQDTVEHQGQAMGRIQQGMEKLISVVQHMDEGHDDHERRITALEQRAS